MKTTAELIQENIARFEVTCKQIDKDIIKRDELIAFRADVLQHNIESIHSTEELLQTLRKQLNYVKS